MALPSSGVMKASMIQAELKETGSWSINAPTSRKLAKVPSGTIKFSDFYGKSAETVVEFLVKGVVNTGFNSYISWGGSEPYTPDPVVQTLDGGPVHITIHGHDFVLRKSYMYQDETADNGCFKSLQDACINKKWGYKISITIPDGSTATSRLYERDTVSDNSNVNWHDTGLIHYGLYSFTGDNIWPAIRRATENNPIDLRFKITIYEY